MVALLGVKDLIGVDTPDALLVAHRSRAQEAGDLVKKLAASERHELAVARLLSGRQPAFQFIEEVQQKNRV